MCTIIFCERCAPASWDIWNMPFASMTSRLLLYSYHFKKRRLRSVPLGENWQRHQRSCPMCHLVHGVLAEQKSRELRIKRGAGFLNRDYGPDIKLNKQLLNSCLCWLIRAGKSTGYRELSPASSRSARGILTTHSARPAAFAWNAECNRVRDFDVPK